MTAVFQSDKTASLATVGIAATTCGSFSPWESTVICSQAMGHSTQGLTAETQQPLIGKGFQSSSIGWERMTSRSGGQIFW